jgi:hypothetical protein
VSVSAFDRDRALELRGRIRDLTIAVAAGGTVFLAAVAAATLPGHSSSTAGGLQQPGQAPGSSSGGSGLVTGGSSLGSQGTAANNGSSLQQPAQLPSSGLGGGGLVTGGS